MLGLRGWPRCPAAYQRHPIWRQVVRMHNAAKISPLADWPDSYAAWVERYIGALEAELSRRAESELVNQRKVARAQAERQ